MNAFISGFTNGFFRGKWKGTDDDSAYLDMGDSYLCFTTDSYTVSPLFFPGGNIGDLAVCGTLNDLAVMGAKPLALSLGLVIEEGFSRDDFDLIMKTIGNLSKKTGVPIVTGDTKVIESREGLLINTSGVGICKKSELLDKEPAIGDKIIVSGSVGDHSAALLSKRFDYETDVVTDSKPIFPEIEKIRDLIKIAKDPTRGGLGGVLYDISDKSGLGVRVEEPLPAKRGVLAVTKMLGLSLYELACEGRFLCVASGENSKEVCKRLPDAQIIGEITEKDVIIKTKIGSSILPRPSGRLIPRIC